MGFKINYFRRTSRADACRASSVQRQTPTQKKKVEHSPLLAHRYRQEISFRIISEAEILRLVVLPKPRMMSGLWVAHVTLYPHIIYRGQHSLLAYVRFGIPPAKAESKCQEAFPPFS